MAKRNDKIKNHVQAARDWLGKAEQSLDQQNELKSNLNLMLAQAELQRANETKQIGYAWFSHPILRIRNMAVVVVIGIVIAFGFSGLYADRTPAIMDKVSSQNSIRQSAAEPAPPAAKPAAGKPAAEKTEPAAEPAARVSASASAAAANEPTTTVKQPLPEPIVPPVKEKVAVSPEEMQQLIRSAGKSLRGQS